MRKDRKRNQRRDRAKRPGPDRTDRVVSFVRAGARATANSVGKDREKVVGEFGQRQKSRREFNTQYCCTHYYAGAAILSIRVELSWSCRGRSAPLRSLDAR